MTRSLRRSLAARFAATMAVGLAAASLAGYWATSRVMLRQLDDALAAAAFLAADNLSHPFDEPNVEPVLATHPAAYAREVNRYIVLRDVTGRAIRAIPAFAADLPVDTGAVRAAARGRQVWQNARWRGERMRTLYYPAVMPGAAGDQALEVAASLEPILVVQRQLLLALAVVVLFGAAATMLGAWSLAGSAVRPAQEITELARRIEAGTLDQRIAAHAETDEYRDLVGVLNRMLERLERQFHAQRRLTADVSHELRSPLTALRGELEVALRAERPPREYQRVLRSALEEIERLTEMSEDLLLISRAEARLVAPVRVPTDLNALVCHELDRLHGRIEEKDLAVRTDLDAGINAVPVDPELIERVVGHLLDNAVKYAPMGGEVAVSTVSANASVQLAVEDSGPGVAPEDLPHIFEPFYRADQARTRGTGTGLGLAVAAAVVRLHGGTITAGPADGAGTRFELALPTAGANGEKPT